MTEPFYLSRSLIEKAAGVLRRDRPEVGHAVEVDWSADSEDEAG